MLLEDEKSVGSRCLDPIENLSPELFDLVFQHFTPKELMRTAFVSRAWHEEIGNSQNMKRIKVFIYHHTQEELNESLIRLFSSQRKYRNVSVNLGTMMFDEKVERCARESNVKYKHVKFSDAKLYDSLWPMEVIESTVRDLSLCNIHCSLECENVRKFKFPNLRHLTLYKNTDSVNSLFIACHNLATFSFTERSGACDSKLIESLLMNNRAMKALGLRVVKCSESLQRVIPKCKFRLEKFSFYSYKLNDPMSVENRNLLCDFLDSQRDCLQILNVDQWCGVNALRTIFNIETLENLSFNINHKGENVNFIQLHSNACITRIDISEMMDNDAYVLSQVLRAVPNVVIYKTCLMQYGDMMLIERHCPNLRQLYVEEFAPIALPPYSDSFSKLTKFKSLDISSELVLLIIAKEEEKRGHFERLILECFAGVFHEPCRLH
jgi:hypothetical protein